ncbi:hypothetical protein [Pantoea sp.]|uniref:hypothetical protein n=1 Tax=Pantoea sp. TaxID=69393 RepID=UPI0028A811DD|nr:hypothetical protein [Pantoea sp.]
MDKLYSALRTQLLDQRINIEEQHHIFTRYLPVLGNNALLKYQLWNHQRYNQWPPAVKTAVLTIPEIDAVQRARRSKPIPSAPPWCQTLRKSAIAPKFSFTLAA